MESTTDVALSRRPVRKDRDRNRVKTIGTLCIGRNPVGGAGEGLTYGSDSPLFSSFWKRRSVDEGGGCICAWMSCVRRPNSAGEIEQG